MRKADSRKVIPPGEVLLHDALLEITDRANSTHEYRNSGARWRLETPLLCENGLSIQRRHRILLALPLLPNYHQVGRSFAAADSRR